jgi:hypothetical protein
VKEIGECWVRQAGYPLLEISEENSEKKIVQKSSNLVFPENFWNFHVPWKSEEKNGMIFFQGKSVSLPSEISENSHQFFKLNAPGHWGFYR